MEARHERELAMLEVAEEGAQESYEVKMNEVEKKIEALESDRSAAAVNVCHL